MKLIALLLVILSGLRSCLLTNKQDNITITAPPADTIRFSTQVLPILKTNCSPCHFTGGIMYKKMPFDSGQTLLSHETGILKRIKKDAEKNIIRQYIEENKTGK